MIIIHSGVDVSLAAKEFNSLPLKEKKKKAIAN